jgi:hypothetical protein
MGTKVKFPAPRDYKPANPAVICPGERVIRLYNQDSGDTAQKIAKKVRIWFASEALKRGWAGIHFLTEVQTNYGAGCVLWRPPPIQIEVKVNSLILDPQSA